MIPKFRAWVHCLNKMLPVKEIDFDDFMPSVMVEINSERHEQMFFKNTDYPDCELMQSTGLYDKNGKEIFEGDIIYWRDLEDIPFDDVVKVEYSEEFFKWVGTDKSGSSRDFYELTDNRALEVIGNIYEKGVESLFNKSLFTDIKFKGEEE